MNKYTTYIFTAIAILYLCTDLHAQHDSTKTKHPFTFGVGVLAGITFNDHPSKTPRNDPEGIDVALGGFVQKPLLQNVSATLGVTGSFFKGPISNNSISSIQIQDSFIVAESKYGDVHITSLRLKIPLRLRLYYLNKKQWRFFFEPGAFIITELKSDREYQYEKTTYYDERTNTFVVPPKVEFITEKLSVNKPWLGVSLGLGLEVETKHKRKLFVSIQYQRVPIYREFRRGVIHHLFALETRFSLSKEHDHQRDQN